MAKKVVVYEMWAPSWPNLAEMTKHLSRIASLGITHVWLSGDLEYPWYDQDQDIPNRKKYLKELNGFVHRAHHLGMKVIIDLVLNHTSTSHSWFRQHPERYCWSDRPGWTNILNGRSAWKYDAKRKKYYLSLLRDDQADLCWFLEGNLNQDLVSAFQKIIHFWIKRKVDGFCIDFPQGLNKDLDSPSLKMNDLVFGDRDDQVINALFPDKDQAPFLMMECFDPTNGELVNHYVDETPIQYVMNAYVRSAADMGEYSFLKSAHQNEEVYGFMLNTEGHNAPRFTQRCRLTTTEALWHLFNTQARAVCLYQGQELGLTSSRYLDSITHELRTPNTQVSLSTAFFSDGMIRATSCANARESIPLGEYHEQMLATNSSYKYTRELIARYYRL